MRLWRAHRQQSHTEEVTRWTACEARAWVRAPKAALLQKHGHLSRSPGHMAAGERAARTPPRSETLSPEFTTTQSPLFGFSLEE